MPSSKAPRAGRKQSAKKPIEQYEHTGETRLNNPPVGLVNPENDPDGGKKSYAYDPHLDPQLVWAGKAEHTSFEVPTVSLHVHERIDPKTIQQAARKQKSASPSATPLELVEPLDKRPPLRVILGSVLLRMNSLLREKKLPGGGLGPALHHPHWLRLPACRETGLREGYGLRHPSTDRCLMTWRPGSAAYIRAFVRVCIQFRSQEDCCYAPGR